MRLIATSAFIAVLILVGMTLMFWGGRGFPDHPMTFARGQIGFVEIAAIAVVYVSIGAFLANRLPRHAVGWGFIVIGVGVALHLPTSLLVGEALRAFRPIPQPLLVFAWALTSLLVPLAVSIVTFLIMILPEGKFPSRRWKRAALATVAGLVLVVHATALNPSGLVWFPTLPNPLTIPAGAGGLLRVVRFIGVALLVLGLALAAGSLVRRYRRSDADLRRQLLWIVGGAVVWAATLAPLLVTRYVVGADDATAALVTHIATLGTIAFPVSVFVATTRYHLFGIDAMIERTLVYVPLMGVCTGIYAAGVALSQRIFISVTGNTSDIAIVIATLLMAAAFTPVRRMLEARVDRFLAAGRRMTPSPSLLETEEEHRHLTEQATALTARLSEIEHRLADLQGRASADTSQAVGEPGVGRTGWPVSETPSS